ncbi:MAG: Cas9 inhibitor AcrIIA9 family protein [Oscillospiraceae bacterium]|nr:Cas9 inhibitor AcrIIA9 family protein [Oscillospiraceae bacterium]
MSKQDDAVVAINMEMQKEPNNAYMEIVGQYIIDRCGDDAAAAAVVDGGKTLFGAMAVIEAAARKKKAGNVGVVTDREVFEAVDTYLGIAGDTAVRDRTKAAVDGAAIVPPQAPEKRNVIALDLSRFL